MMTTKHLYIHIPFCKSICGYCDFCHQIYRKDVADKWLLAFEKELKECEKETYKTLYVGGGTPTSLNLEQLDKFFNLVKPYTKDVLEYTVEANPESLDEDKIKLFKTYGINRVSIGVQSTSEEELKLMGRNHRFLDVKEKIELLKKHGITNISTDIIYSLPNQTMESLKKTLDDVLSLNLPHLSIYSLTIEDNSIFAKKGLNNLDEETEANMYEYIVNRLNEAGYIQYEVANFAKKGYESKHNLGYWNFDDYRGLSCGSTSKINHHMIEKTRSIKDYIEGKNIIANDELLDLKDECFEQTMMSLRTIYGLDLDMFKQRYGLDALKLYEKALAIHKNAFVILNNHLICQKRNILNTVLLDFLD